jgi:ubiquinone/menaquinone biosynthesis C-methylase UbiE
MPSPSWQYDEYSHLATDFHDPKQVAAYDARQHTKIEEERALVGELGLTNDMIVLEYGPGTGAFARAAATVVRQVHAVDISHAMLDYARSRAQEAGTHNIAFHHGGFLTYTHQGEPADVIVTKFALHHLPDFWKGVALKRMAGFLKPGGRFVLQDVIFSFDPEDFEVETNRWIDEQTADGSGFSRADFEAHIRDEHSTFTWVLNALFDRAGFEVEACRVDSPTYAWFFCKKRG